MTELVKADAADEFADEIMELRKGKKLSWLELLEACSKVAGFTLGAMTYSCCRNQLHNAFKRDLKTEMNSAAQWRAENMGAMRSAIPPRMRLGVTMRTAVAD